MIIISLLGSGLFLSWKKKFTGQKSIVRAPAFSNPLKNDAHMCVGKYLAGFILHVLREGISTENLQNLHLQQGCAGNPQTGHSSCWSSFLAKYNISWQICFLRDSYVSALADASADIAHCGVHTDQTATWEVQIQGFQESKLRRTQFQKPARLTFEGGRGS